MVDQNENSNDISNVIMDESENPDSNIDNDLLNKYAPKIVEGTKRLKAWVESI